MINCLLFGMMTNHKNVFFFIVIIITFIFIFFLLFIQRCIADLVFMIWLYCGCESDVI